MFWNNFVKLCNNIGKSPNGVCADLGYSTAIASKWKKGATPRDTTLKKIADYFGVTVDDLKADSTSTSAPTPQLEPKAGTAFFLTAQEAKVLTAYRNQPDMQPAVDRILGVTMDGYVTVYAAANSESNHKHTITRIPQDKWNEIENEPNTDEDLM